MSLAVSLRKRRKARRAAIVAVAAAVLLSASCSAGDKRPDEAKITLTFRHFWTKEHDKPIARIMGEVVSRFEASHPNIKVDFEGLDQTVHREQKLKSEMVTGNPPDIFALFGGAELEPYVRAERLLDFSSFLRNTGLSGRFHDLSLWTFQDRVYGLPLEGFAEPVYYNKRLFAELGLHPPHSGDELLEIVRKLKQAGIIPFALGNEERWQGAMFYHYFLQRYAGSQAIARIAGGSGSFRNEEFRKGTEKFAEFCALKPFPDQPNALGKERAAKLFLEGKAAMYLNGSWEINLFQGPDAPPDFPQRIGVFNFPPLAKDGGEGAGGLAGGYTLGLGVSANVKGERLKAVLELLQDIYTPEVQQRIVYEGLRLPSMEVDIDPNRTGPVLQQVAQLLSETGSSFIPYDNALPPAVQEAFFQAAAQLIDGETTASGALQEMDARLEQYRKLGEETR